jgi:hypothetical protein
MPATFEAACIALNVTSPRGDLGSQYSKNDRAYEGQRTEETERM